MIKLIYFTMFLIACCSISLAQFPYSFYEIARTTNIGYAEKIAINSDGTLFVTYGDGGMRAYTYNGSKFTNTAHIIEEESTGEDLLFLAGKSFDGIAVGNNGTIFIAHSDGLKAYTYNGYSFTNTAHINDGGKAHGVAVSDNGTIFLANGSDGLRAYIYDGSSFTNVGHIDDGGTNGDAKNVCIGPQGVIFLANYRDGIRAYTHESNSFTNRGKATTLSPLGAWDVAVGNGNAVIAAYDGIFAVQYDYTNLEFKVDGAANISRTGTCRGVAVSSDGTIFASFPDDKICGIYTYYYDGLTLHEDTHATGTKSSRDIAFGSDGTVFSASGSVASSKNGGLRAFTYDGSDFSYITSIYDGGFAEEVAISNDGTVFLANASGGLRAYDFDGSSLSEAGQIYDKGLEKCVAIGPDGTIFLANESDGLRAYTFGNKSFANIGHSEVVLYRLRYNTMVIDSVGTIFIGSDELLAFTFDGEYFTNIAHLPDDNANYANGIALGSNDIIFTANGNSGLNAYSFDGSSFSHLGNNAEVGYAYDVAVAPNGTIFVANSDLFSAPGANGLGAYTFDGSSFTNVGHIDEDISGYGVAVGSDGTVFLAAGWNGLKAYSYDGSSFENIAYLDNITADDITIGSDGLVYVAGDEDGMYVFNYTVTEISDKQILLPSEFQLSQNYPNPFNPSTTIEFTLPKSEFVTIKIYNILGEEISTLVNNKLQAGNHTYQFDGGELASGIYLYSIEAGEFQDVKKMILMK